MLPISPTTTAAITTATTVLAPTPAIAVTRPVMHVRQSAIELDALRASLFQAIRESDAGRLQSLLVNGRLSPNAVDAGTGWSPLMEAAHTGHAGIVPILLQAGAAVNQSAGDGLCPLMLAARHENSAVLKLLLDAGARIDAADEEGLTALMYAVMQGESACAQMLIAAGANIMRRNDEGKTVLDFAEKWQHSDLARQLKQWAAARFSGSGLIRPKPTVKLSSRDAASAGSVTSVLLNAVARRDPDAVRDLLDAWRQDKRDLARELNLAGRPGHGISGITEPCTALMLAAWQGEKRIANMLLSAGASVDTANPQGRTALVFAVQREDPDMVQLLLDAGARPELARLNDSSVLMLAAKNGGTAIVQALLQAGANADATADNGDTALELAESAGYTTTAKVLRQAGASKF